jgi:antitoxin component YwqK of YwqJK toxin-antitoxin module
LGKLDGHFIEYFEKSTQIRKECNFKNNKLNGDFISFYQNGEVKLKCVYRENVQVGEKIEFFNDGSIVHQSNTNLIFK